MIDSFRGRYRFLSNFFMLQYPIHWRGINYPSSEHFYQAMKTTDYELRVKISLLKDAYEAKTLGNALLCRPDWDLIRDPAMDTGVLLKFSINADLANMLVATDGHLLVEGNHWHDNYWGNCNCVECIKTPGLNKIGLMLMGVRRRLMTIG